ncbi:MAG: DNA mismatch repair endonuclease MutL, partial [Spirulinaceae cyanobacterium RM2_2_10]|nr:DNA mismatch repair endonuclease MutL [Spirulinaceae cyanobacterium RM2_2_10]
RITIALHLPQWHLQVTDNGRGMSRADLCECAQPHSTSKIHHPADLWRISSLGFRGEALHSLAQLAQLEIRSRAQGSDSGWLASYNHHGRVIAEEIAAIAPGTIISVRDLFGRVPVRRHALPALNQQLKDIQTIVQHAALCQPQVNWQVWQDDQLWLQIYAGETVQAIAPQLLRRVSASDLHYGQLEVTPPGQNTPARLELLAGLPDRCHRRRADWVKVAVNGRLVRSPQLEQALIGGFARTLPRDRYPLSFLHLHLPPSQIDWNRHPAKTEIYLQKLDFWRSQVQELLGNWLQLPLNDSPARLLQPRLEQLLKTAESPAPYQFNRQIAPTPAPTAASELPQRQLRAVGQVNNTYIVAEHASGLWLVEQHIAHERVLYEQLRAAWELLPVEPPLVLQLSVTQVDALQNLGLTVDLFGQGLWAVRSLPGLLRDRDDCLDAIVELSRGGDLQTAQVATACRSAIRNGTPLSLPEMQQLLDQWQATRQPRTCPHGRPIFLALEETALARFFRRHWVIGKSHGI